MAEIHAASPVPLAISAHALPQNFPPLPGSQELSINPPLDATLMDTPPEAQELVSPAPTILSGSTIALTFDDGPHKTLTPELLDYLKEQHISVTFFVLGKNATAYPDIVKRAFQEGHDIENHSWNHPHLPKLSQANITNEINQTDIVIQQLIGMIPKYMRPPYGDINHLVTTLSPHPLVLWSVDTKDWQTKDSELIARRVLENIHDGDIVLMHDIHPQSIAAVKLLIPKLLAQGVHFVTISELFQSSPIKAGTILRKK